MTAALRRLAPAFFAAILAFPVLASPSSAQEKGTLSGRVNDKASGHAIAFATVSIPAIKAGALTDPEGQYTLKGVPAGTYDVRIQFLGYKPEVRSGVVVTAGRTTTLNFLLEEIVVREEKAVEATAERQLVEVRQGATIRSVNASEIRNLPVQTVSDVLQQQAGITTENDQIHVRGGRTDETIFVVNGVANRDLVTGQSTAGQLNARSVAEVNVATGAYDVRYGNALSGVVEIKLREGGDKLAGGLTMTSGTWGARNVQAVVGGPDPVFRPIVNLLFGAHAAMSSILDVSGTLYDTRFRSLGHTDSQNDVNVFGFSPSSPLKSSYRDSFLGNSFEYGPFFTSSEDNRWAARYALTVKPNEQDKINLNVSKRIAIDQGFSRTFINAAGDAGDPAYPWVWAHRIDHAPTIFEDNVQTSLQWRRTLSHTGFTELQLSRYFNAYRQDVQGKMWWEYDAPYDKSLADSVQANDFFIDTGDDNAWEDRRSTSYGLNWSVTQRLHRHEIELGLEHQLQTVQRARIEDPWVYDPNGLGGAHDLWRVHPWVGDFFLRDRLEYEGFTANVGLRGDYWFIGKEAERAVADTNSNVSPTTRADFYRNTQSFFGRRYKLKLSPRLIVAHPISEHSSFFFNYGEFTQIPSYRFVYSKLTSISSESFPLLGNPDLNPQVSVNYELGAKHQFLPTAAINATFFVKDIYDYPSATTFRRQQGTSLVDILVYLNGHFARSKGFEIELEKRRSHYWSGRLVYTYQQTKGKSSDPNAAKVVQENGGDASETPLAQTFVTWNRPHKVTLSFDMRFDDDAPERWGLLKHSGVNVYIQGQSGRPYTPYAWVGTEKRAIGETNSKNAPFQITTDLRINHKLQLGSRAFDLSLAGTNIFNNFIINRVDDITGEGRIWGVGDYDPRSFSGLSGSARREAEAYSYESDIMDPSNYGPGAQWRVSLDYDF